ncbi:hypothetical protein M758_1G211300 [Ceratodon purpureus]|nr:hypothetical protein M758_1G211300 [Ceratodon purpureus]
MFGTNSFQLMSLLRLSTELVTGKYFIFCKPPKEQSFEPRVGCTGQLLSVLLALEGGGSSRSSRWCSPIRKIGVTLQSVESSRDSVEAG